MPIPFDNVLNAPLEVIQSILLNLVQEQKDLRSDWGVPQYFTSLINGEWEKVGFQESRSSSVLIVQKVPLITQKTIDSYPSGSLVRFRGMIQDMLDPEFYLGVYEEVNSTTGQKVL